MNRDKKPLPRFWYFPRSLKAVVIGTGDDHGNGGTAGRFDQYKANSPAGCSVANWACLRFSSYVYPNTPGLSDAAAAAYTSQGFEVGVHETTGCANFTAASLADHVRQRHREVAGPTTRASEHPAHQNRTHCMLYSDWSTQPKTELANGMRLDGNYYYWPGSWVQNRPGFMTGSGMPMRFADTDGSMIDVYQAPTQMTDESDQTYPFTPDTLLDNAVGPLGYYGAFNANMHTDAATTPESDALLSSAKAHNVPIVSGRQMLTWLDGRNASSYSGISWNNNTLGFTVQVGAGATGLTGMLPTAGPNGTQLTGITRAGVTVSTTTTTVKGIEYASFDAAAGSYSATYAAPPGPVDRISDQQRLAPRISVHSCRGDMTRCPPPRRAAGPRRSRFPLSTPVRPPPAVGDVQLGDGRGLDQVSGRHGGYLADEQGRAQGRDPQAPGHSRPAQGRREVLLPGHLHRPPGPNVTYPSTDKPPGVVHDADCRCHAAQGHCGPGDPPSGRYRHSALDHERALDCRGPGR